MGLSNYPPGVTGNEPHLTGEYPCSACGGVGGDFDEDGGYACQMCGGSGIHPEDPPACFHCGEPTEWFADLAPAGQAAVTDVHGAVASYDEFNVAYCESCGEVSR